MSSLTDEIRALLREQGCTIVGFADLRCLSKEARQNFDCGIAIGLSYTRKAMEENMKGLPAAYYAEFTPINKKLPQLAVMTADYLISRGYKALSKVSSMIVQDENYRTVLAHKTVATLAGIGWIGKCATLLIVMLTDAPLECGVPVTESLCPE